MFREVRHDVCVYNMLQNFTVYTCTVSDIGRSFEGWDLSPFLNKGVMIACFQTCGMAGSREYQLQTRRNFSSHGFSNLAGISSGP